MSNLPAFSLHPCPASERAAALHLITDSIAQQRQTLSRSILSSPVFLLPSLSLLSLVFYLNRTNIPTAVILLSGVCIAILSAIRMEGAQYLEEAERMGREGIEVLNEEEEGTKTVVATWGEKVVGVAVVRQGELWAWTVLLRYRRSGLGRDLLARVVKEAGEEGVKGVAKDNANSYRIKGLPGTFNAPFASNEELARRVLMEVSKGGKKE
ncbi:hypothetical protein BZA05DRAFT_403546 [Tricharina praecox]|uniref:uncharacterized protein n=1 Tax=Tricharina praecox TaxID=43433 RepID=UPI00221F12AD|nr:uncharacterized protein BZA05DRAFT_403546 [Tricharina praecox]KAI5848277.1 hypothetical protein BZA05DRAFT_403546 [Tricharina praecox]